MKSRQCPSEETDPLTITCRQSVRWRAGTPSVKQAPGVAFYRGIYSRSYQKNSGKQILTGQSASSPHALSDSGLKWLPTRFSGTDRPVYLHEIKQYLRVPSRWCPHIRLARQRPPVTFLHSSYPPGSELLQRTHRRGKIHLQ